MNILVIGSGGREHAICWKLNNEKNVENIYCAPGNAGIANVAKCVDIKETNIEELLKFAKENSIDLTIVGPEVPLVMGIVDEFQKEGLKIFGPNKDCSQLEGSKAYTKQFLIRHNIPTAKYGEYTDFEKAKNDINKFGYPIVIKADGLAAGKGVVIVDNEKDAITTLVEMMQNNKFGEAGNKVVLEEFLEGIETSILAFVDGNSIVPMVSAKDHKKIFENETGLNTGGMGTFSPSEIYTKELEKIIENDILKRTLEGFKEDNLNYQGIIFVGLMITKDGPKVLEYNCRFGDPETQSVLMRLDTDLSEIILKILDKKLDRIDIKYKKESAVCVVLTSGGYPGKYEVGYEIKGLDNLDKDVVAFHSGTKKVNGKIVTNGGRVLGITALGKNVEDAANIVYENIKKIQFKNMHYRKDIGIKFK